MEVIREAMKRSQDLGLFDDLYGEINLYGEIKQPEGYYFVGNRAERRKQASLARRLKEKA